MKKMLLMGVLFGAIFAGLVGCTQQERAKAYGGTMTVNLPAGQKFIEATWKGGETGANLWYTTRPMRANETAETFTFQESSNYGMWEGKVIFVESK